MASLPLTPVATPRFASVLQAQASDGSDGTQILSLSRWDLDPSFWEPCTWEHADYYDYPHPRTCTIVQALQSACMQGDYGPAEEFSTIDGPPLMSFNGVSVILYLPRGDTIQLTLPEQSDVTRNPASYFSPHIREKYFHLSQSGRCVLSISTYYGPLLQITLPPRVCYTIHMPTSTQTPEPYCPRLGWTRPATPSHHLLPQTPTNSTSIIPINSLLNPTEARRGSNCRLVDIMRTQAKDMAYFADLGDVISKTPQEKPNTEGITSQNNPPSPKGTCCLPNTILSEGNWTVRFMNCHCPARLHIVVMGQETREDWGVPMALIARTLLAHMPTGKR